MTQVDQITDAFVRTKFTRIPVGTDLDRVILADDEIHDELGEKEDSSQPKDMNIAGIIFN